MKYLITILFLFINLSSFTQGTYFGYVVKIIDGDTFYFKIDSLYFQAKLSNIDAPELDQDWGKQSKKFLEKCLNKFSQLDVDHIDKNGKLYGYLYQKNDSSDISVNLTMLFTGNAWYEDEGDGYYIHDREYYELAHKCAKFVSVGLWYNEFKTPIKPSVWRKMSAEEKLYYINKKK